MNYSSWVNIYSWNDPDFRLIFSIILIDNSDFYDSLIFDKYLIRETDEKVCILNNCNFLIVM